MGMPQNKNEYILTHARMGLAFGIYALFLFGTFGPIFFMAVPPGDTVAMVWCAASGLSGSFLGLRISSIRDGRCALPEGLRATFFRTLEHPWKETRRVGDHVEQFCSRCEQYRHGKMTRYDLVETWEAGKIEA
jgi:hypothetical protein